MTLVDPDIAPTAPAAALNPTAARSLYGLTGLPTIVAMGPFDDLAHAERLAATFNMVRLWCRAQLIHVGFGGHRATVMRRSFALGVGSSVHVIRDLTEDRWPFLIAAADVVVPNTAAASITLLDVLGAGRPAVAQAAPATVRLVVPASAGPIYRPGDVSGMAGALLRLLTSPAVRHGMGCGARAVARRIACSGCRCSGHNKGTNMHDVIGRLIQWVAEILDRSLLTVPDLDEQYSAHDTSS